MVCAALADAWVHPLVGREPPDGDRRHDGTARRPHPRRRHRGRGHPARHRGPGLHAGAGRSGE
jgi:hypothetical protein